MINQYKYDAIKSKLIFKLSFPHSDYGEELPVIHVVYTAFCFSYVANSTMEPLNEKKNDVRNANVSNTTG